MYEIALCDNDVDFLPAFKDMLSAILTGKGIPYHLSTFLNIDSLDQSISRGAHYDLIFLDLLLETNDGLQFARRLREKKAACRNYFHQLQQGLCHREL